MDVGELDGFRVGWIFPPDFGVSSLKEASENIKKLNGVNWRGHVNMIKFERRFRNLKNNIFIEIFII